MSARPASKSSIACSSAAVAESVPTSIEVAAPEKELSRAIQSAMRHPAAARKESALGAGRDSTRWARADSSHSSGAFRFQLRTSAIVWSMKKVCSSQLTVEALNSDT